MLPRPRRDVLWLAAGLAMLLAYWLVGVVWRVDGKVDRAGADLLFYFLPDYAHLAERMRAGELPRWNRLHGQPFLATLLPGTLYPARLLLLAFAPQTAMHIATVVHLLLCFAGTFLLCRALEIGPLGALAGGITFTGIHGFSALYWPPFLEGGAWLPVAALALVRLAATGSWAWTMALGASTGLIVLAGCYQHALYAVYGLAVLGVALLADSGRRGWLVRPGGVARLAVAGALALATAAPQALPTLAWSALTVRSGGPLTDVQLDRLPFPRLVWDRMFAPWGTDSPMLVSIPVAAMALVGCLASRGFGVVLLVASVTTVALCLGRGGPAFELYRLLPGFAAFRLPERLIFLVGFFLAIGAALGVGRLARSGRLGRTLAVGASVAIAIGLLGPRRVATELPWTLSADRLAGPPALMDLVTRYTAGGRTLLTGGGANDLIAVKQPGMHGVLSLQDYNSLSSSRLAAYLQAVVGKPPQWPSDGTFFLGFLPMTEKIVRPALLDMAAVRTVLLKDFVIVPGRDPAFRRVGESGRWVLYENPAALPRAYTIERARVVADDAAAFDAIVAPGFEPRDEVVLAGTPVDEAPTLAAGPPGTLRDAHIVDDRPEQVVIETRAERTGVLVLTDPIAPGWRATVDGRPVPLLAANYLGRGVRVPAGTHRVEFVYEAPGLALGFAVFALTWATAGVIAVVRRLGHPAAGSRTASPVTRTG